MRSPSLTTTIIPFIFTTLTTLRQNPQALSQVRTFGIDEPFLIRGRDLLDQWSASHGEARTWRQRVSEAEYAFEKAKAGIDDAYLTNLPLAHRLFAADVDAQATLPAAGTLPQETDPWGLPYLAFYSYVLSHRHLWVPTSSAAFASLVEGFQGARRQVTRAKRRWATAHRLRLAADEATRARIELLQDIHTYEHRLREALRHAQAETPHPLEGLTLSDLT